LDTENDSITKTTKCLNCGTEFEGDFCPKCGQNAETSRYTLRFIADNFVTALSGKDGSIWFTLKSLFTRPGEMIVDNLNGKRKKYLSPFPMLFMVLTLYLLIVTLFNASILDLVLEDYVIPLPADASIEEIREHEVHRFLDNCLRFYYGHYTLSTIVTLPLAVMAARVCYGKNNRKRYYWAEYIVSIVYATVIVILFRCLIKLFYPLEPDTITTIGLLFSPLVGIVANTACFRKMLGFSVAKTVWRSVLSRLLYLLMMAAILFFIMVIFAIYIVAKY